MATFINGDDLLLIQKNVEGLKERREVAINTMLPPGYGRIMELQKPTTETVDLAVKKYLKYMNLLSSVKKIDNIESPINVYAINRDHLMLILTSETTLPIGALYEIRPEMKKALSSNTAEASGIYKDKDGTWISAFAPISLSPGAKPEVILEIDNKIDLYMKLLRDELAIIILICIIVFVGTAGMGYKLINRLVSAIKKLDQMATYIGKENYNIKVVLESKDEIGHLAETFERLRLSIRKKIDELKLSLITEKRAHLESIIALSNAIEVRDPHTREHLYRVDKYALLIARAMRLPRNEVEILRYGCYLHDIGKIYIDNKTLQKSELSENETERIRKHAENGAKIIEGIPFLQKVRDIILYHQERYDGKGYPRGLEGADIPLLARIVAVADSFDAMTTDRPYKPKASFREAMDTLEKNAGIQFDPVVIKAFLKYRDNIENIAKKHFKISLP